MLAAERLKISVEERNSLSISRIPPLPTIFVVQKSYKTQKAQDLVGLVLFLLLYFVVRALCGIFEFRSCISALFSKKGV